MNDLADFIRKELQRRKRYYSESPLQILRDFRIERESVESYNGRQLLEMLQNVDDACETAKEKEALIRLSNGSLIIANNGEPFSVNGFKSILNSNISAKTKKQNKIGQKGLGFRSILSWADEVVIHSEGTSVRFSQSIATAFLAELKEGNPQIEGELSEFTDDANPIAVLCVPEVVDGASTKEPFDTVIEIKLKEGIAESVESQISNIINKETLLFLNNLEVVQIDTPQTSITYRKIWNGKDSVTVRANDTKNQTSTDKTWKVKRAFGKHKNKNYELAVAWNDELSDTENVLYSYFRTNVSFPFPALLHGTFELTSDRNELVDDTNGHNRFLMARVVDLLLDVALEIAAREEKSSYSPLTFLNVKFDGFQGFLKEANFEGLFREKLKEALVLPSVNGGYIAHTSEPAYYDYPVADLLQGGDVEDLLPTCKDDSLLAFLKSLTLFEFSLSDYISIVSRRAGKLAPREIATLIHHLLTNESYKKQLLSGDFRLSDCAPILPDEEGDLIPWTASIFLPTDGGSNFALPKEISVSFVNSELTAELTDLFEVSDIAEIAEELAPLAVKLYSFTEVATLLIEHFNRRKVTPKDVQQLHAHLFRLFKHEAKRSSPAGLPDAVTVPVISDKSKVVAAQDTYLGKHYGSDLTEDLFGFNKNKLLAQPKLFRLADEHREKVVAYFKWLGVGTLPRHSVIQLPYHSEDFKSYVEHVLRSVDYRKPIDPYYGDKYENYDALSQQLWGATQVAVGYFDGLKEILKRARPETIFRWVKEDSNLRRSLEENSEILDGTFVKLSLKRKQDYRNIRKQQMRSYVRWLISTAAWIPVQSTVKKAMPDICCTSRTISDDFSPFVEKPKLNIALLADKLELNEEMVKSFMVMVGIHQEISDFSTARLYGMLSSLQNSDREGRVARSIYREVILNFNENRIDKTDIAYKKFVATGSVFCLKGKASVYVPVREAYYVETRTLGENILSRFPLIAIDAKRGAQKVRTLFGVEALKNVNFKLLNEPDSHPLDAAFDDDIRRFKPLVYALRMREDKDGEIRNRLKRLRIYISPSVEAEFEHAGEREGFELRDYEFIPKNRTTFYIRVPSRLTSVNELKHSIRFCESIAEIFTTVINTEDYRDFLHDLYSKNASEREPRLLSYTQEDSNSELQIARNQLGLIDDIRLSFWRAFAFSSKRFRKTELIDDVSLDRFFKTKLRLDEQEIENLSALKAEDDFSEFEMQSLLQNLFVKFGVDYNHFSRHFSALDFTSYFQDRLENAKNQNRAEFAQKLYEKLLDSAMADKTKFFRYLDDFDDISYDAADGFVGSINAYLQGKVLEKFSIGLESQPSLFSIENVLSESLSQLRANGLTVPDGLLARKDVQALLLFEEWERLRETISANSASGGSGGRKASDKERLVVRGKEIEFGDLKSLAAQVLDGMDFSKLKIKKSKTAAIDGTNARGRRGARGNSRKIEFNKRTEELAGFVAELYCYHKLCDTYGEENVTWVSENAFKAGYALTSEAGFGYDIMLELNGEVTYFEVKGVSDVRKGITMSTNEIEKAVEFPNKYNLLIVENPLGDDLTFRVIEKPFRFRGKEENLLSNHRFKVVNDTYLLKFTWA